MGVGVALAEAVPVVDVVGGDVVPEVLVVDVSVGVARQRDEAFGGRIPVQLMRAMGAMGARG